MKDDFHWKLCCIKCHDVSYTDTLLYYLFLLFFREAKEKKLHYKFWLSLSKCYCLVQFFLHYMISDASAVFSFSFSARHKNMLMTILWHFNARCTFQTLLFFTRTTENVCLTLEDSYLEGKNIILGLAFASTAQNNPLSYKTFTR